MYVKYIYIYIYIYLSLSLSLSYSYILVILYLHESYLTVIFSLDWGLSNHGKSESCGLRPGLPESRGAGPLSHRSVTLNPKP